MKILNANIKIRKYFKILVIAIFSILLLLILIFQYEIETYRLKQIKLYGILNNRPRLKYEPAFIYYLFDSGSKTNRAFLLPYIENNLNEFCSNGFYDSYIVNCYYTDREITEYLNH